MSNRGWAADVLASGGKARLQPDGRGGVDADCRRVCGRASGRHVLGTVCRQMRPKAWLLLSRVPGGCSRAGKVPTPAPLPSSASVPCPEWFLRQCWQSREQQHTNKGDRQRQGNESALTGGCGGGCGVFQVCTCCSGVVTIETTAKSCFCSPPPPPSCVTPPVSDQQLLAFFFLCLFPLPSFPTCTFALLDPFPPPPPSLGSPPLARCWTRIRGGHHGECSKQPLALLLSTSTCW